MCVNKEDIYKVETLSWKRITEEESYDVYIGIYEDEFIKGKNVVHITVDYTLLQDKGLVFGVSVSKYIDGKQDIHKYYTDMVLRYLNYEYYIKRGVVESFGGWFQLDDKTEELLLEVNKETVKLGFKEPFVNIN